jgi:hypothetical protein
MAGLVKAQLIELTQDFKDVKSGGQSVEVQFNPDSLKVSFANQIATPSGGDQSQGSSGRQFVGAGTTKLALTLWFDVTVMEKDPVDDVRRLTQKVIYFMTPQKSDADPKKLAPPGVRFLWGSFKFDGMVDSLEESLEFFSGDGKPLRASIALALSQQKILQAEFTGDGKVPKKPGTQPLSAAKQNGSLQNMAAQAGKSDWQSIAAANGIEDPLRMQAGAMIDLNASAVGSIGLSGGVSAGASITPPSVNVSASLSDSAGTGFSLNASIG